MKKTGKRTNNRVQPPIIDKHPAGMLVSVFRGSRVCLHLVYGLLLAVIYPHLNPSGQHRTLKNWNRQLLTILNIGILIEGEQPVHGKGGCLIVANHVSWLDIIVMNAIHPSRFIAKSEVRDWPVIGWLCRRCGTVFIERASRKDALAVNRSISELLGQDVSIGLFPEGTTTEGKQVGPFYSALIQPAIDAGARVLPMALRYQDMDGEAEFAAAFIGDMTLTQSIWNILRCKQQNALVVFTPAMATANANRRVLAQAAHGAIAQALLSMGSGRQIPLQLEEPDLPIIRIPSLSAYELIVDPLLNQLPAEDS
jgi:1-acyl-sn-glycerol-3-phosphate acyltransferase